MQCTGATIEVYVAWKHNPLTAASSSLISHRHGDVVWDTVIYKRKKGN